MILDVLQNAASLRPPQTQGEAGRMAEGDPATAEDREFADMLSEDGDKTDPQAETAQKLPDPPVGSQILVTLPPEPLGLPVGTDDGVDLVEPVSVGNAPPMQQGLPGPAPDPANLTGLPAGAGTSSAAPPDHATVSKASLPPTTAGAFIDQAAPPAASQGPDDPNGLLAHAPADRAGPALAADDDAPATKTIAPGPVTVPTSGAETIMRAMFSPQGAEAGKSGPPTGDAAPEEEEAPPASAVALLSADKAAAATGALTAKDSAARAEVTARPEAPQAVQTDPPAADTGGQRDDTATPQKPEAPAQTMDTTKISPAAVAEASAFDDDTFARSLAVQAEQTIRLITTLDGATRAAPPAPGQTSVPLPPPAASVTVNPAGIELQLPVEDLGALRMEFVQSGDRLHVAVAADRPELLDLLRRHADLLATELRQSGFAGTDISFGSWAGTGQQAQRTSPTDHADDTTGPAIVTGAADFNQPPPVPAGQLNLRM